MKLEAVFAFEIGDFACMQVDSWSDRPDKVQIIAAWIQRDFSGTWFFYQVRSHTTHNSDVLQVFESELAPYPSEEVLMKRTRDNDVMNEKKRERVAQMRASQAAAIVLPAKVRSTWRKPRRKL